MFDMPSWQASAHVPKASGRNATGRGVPDVAGNADGATGYNILMTINGKHRPSRSEAPAQWRRSGRA